MTTTPYKQFVHELLRHRHRGWATLLLCLFLGIACGVGETPRPTAQRVTLLPTFTPTGAAPMPAATINLDSPTSAALPRPSATAARESAVGATLPTVLNTTIPTATPPYSPTTTVSPTRSLQPIATIPATMLTPTPPPSSTTSLYVVQAGDTLSTIAQQQQTTVAALKAANGLTDDLIYPEQALVIPRAIPPLALAPVVVPASAPPAPIQPLSVLEGDLAAAYPLTVVTERFTLHYSPHPPPAQPPEVLVDIIARALVHHEEMLQVTLSGRFDVYVAGSPFAPPDQSLRGHSYSADRYFVFLNDGSGNLDDLTYLIAHELTHMFVWLIFGRPTDPMLSEGAAVYVGMDFIAHAQHIPITTFCAAYEQVDKLPWVSARLTYKGHIRDLENYYGAGCFVKYLIETYGVEKFGKLYPSNDYIGIYGKTLAQLDAEWHVAFATMSVPVPFAADTFVHLVDRLKIAHATLFNTFTGTPEQMAQYRALDQVRMALLEGRLADVQIYFAP